MAYIELKKEDIDFNILYVTRNELVKRTGVSKSTIERHVARDYLDALKFRNRVFFHPKVADEYEKLSKCGLFS